MPQEPTPYSKRLLTHEDELKARVRVPAYSEMIQWHNRVLLGVQISNIRDEKEYNSQPRTETGEETVEEI